MVSGKNNDYSSDEKRKSVVKNLHGPKRKSLMHQLHGSNPINNNDDDDNDSDGNSDETEQDNADKDNSTENSSIEIGEYNKWSICHHTAIYKFYRVTVFNLMTADNMIQPDNDTDNDSAEKTQTSVVKHLHGPKRKSVASHTHGRNPDNSEKDESAENNTERGVLGAGEIKL